MMASRNNESMLSCPVCNTRQVPLVKGVIKDGVQAAACINCGHFFKFKVFTPFKSSISLTVNGQTYTVGNEYSPSTALNTFLRDKRISVGTKHMCFQGGCGSCLVEAKLFEPISEEKLSYAVNSLLGSAKEIATEFESKFREKLRKSKEMSGQEPGKK